MKILIFSDSHKHNSNMELVTDRLSGDIRYILHLGDHSADADKLARRYPGLEIDWVSGNCDFSSGPAEKVISLGGKRIFIAHGHQYGVKYGYQRIAYAALEKDVDACFFGHTHQSTVFYEEGVLFLNPGSISIPRGAMYPSYGVADISKNGIEGSIVSIHPKYGN